MRSSVKRRRAVFVLSFNFFGFGDHFGTERTHVGIVLRRQSHAGLS
jgi:hypothetical protein